MEEDASYHCERLWRVKRVLRSLQRKGSVEGDLADEEAKKIIIKGKEADELKKRFGSATSLYSSNGFQNRASAY